ncbi:hypothetical protein ANN_00661, partial [Periplaneta americana]
MGCKKKASKLFGIPRMTLKRRVMNSNQDTVVDVFDDTDFAPSLNTDRPLNHVESSNDSETLSVDPVPSTSSDTPNDGSIIILPAAISPQPSSSFTVNLEGISSPPKSTIARSQKRKTGSAEILTSRPYKNQLAQEREGKGAKDKTKNNKQSTIKGVRRNIMKNNHIETKKQQQKTTKVALREETSSEERSYLRSTGGEGWIRCSSCLEWTHEKCAVFEDDGSDDFKCDFC